MTEHEKNLRDAFAALAMHAELTRAARYPDSPKIAEVAYAVADSMLLERARRS